MNPIDEVQWGHDWVWGVPLVALTCVIHILCLAVFSTRVDHLLDTMRDRGRHVTLIFSLVMVMAVTLVTTLHILEGGIWAVAFRYLGAIPDNRSAMLYSLGALTTYGDTTIHLAHQWKMLGALEAVNGMLLFGLTTAFLFAMIQRVLPTAKR